MKLYSTNNHELSTDFQTAVFNSMPQDKGLYMPDYIPELDQEFIANIDKFTFSQIAYKVASVLMKDAIPLEDLQVIIDDAINFEAPVVELAEHTHVLELFHGCGSPLRHWRAPVEGRAPSNQSSSAAWIMVRNCRRRSRVSAALACTM